MEVGGCALIMALQQESEILYEGATGVCSSFVESGACRTDQAENGRRKEKKRKLVLGSRSIYPASFMCVAAVVG